MREELGPEILELDALLRRAAQAFSYPPAPPIADAVATRLREPTPPPLAALAGGLLETMRGWWWRPATRVTLAALAAVLVVVGIALAVPQSRRALADFFGFGHVRVEIGPPLGPPPPVLSPQSFARPVSLRTAQQAVDFPSRFPTRDGAHLRPDAVYLQGEGASLPVVIFVYEDEGFDLYQTRAGFFGKGGPDPSLIHEIQFGGHEALRIDEGGHIASFLDAQGRVMVESRRTVGRATLLWEQDGITYRLETSLPQEEAIRVAESLR